MRLIARLRNATRASESASIRRKAAALLQRHGFSLEEGENGPSRVSGVPPRFRRSRKAKKANDFSERLLSQEQERRGSV